jgi:hypothetical protein
MNRLIGIVALSLTATTVLHAQIRMRTGFTNPYNTCQSVTLGLHGGPAGIVSIVRQVDPLSPEALAGLRPGDTIVVMNGTALGRPLAAGSPRCGGTPPATRTCMTCAGRAVRAASRSSSANGVRCRLTAQRRAWMGARLGASAGRGSCP